MKLSRRDRSGDPLKNQPLFANGYRVSQKTLKISNWIFWQFMHIKEKLLPCDLSCVGGGPYESIRVRASNRTSAFKLSVIWHFKMAFNPYP